MQPIDALMQQALCLVQHVAAAMQELGNPQVSVPFTVFHKVTNQQAKYSPAYTSHAASTAVHQGFEINLCQNSQAFIFGGQEKLIDSFQQLATQNYGLPFQSTTLLQATFCHHATSAVQEPQTLLCTSLLSAVSDGRHP
jgi:hypothetical protein